MYIVIGILLLLVAGLFLQWKMGWIKSWTKPIDPELKEELAALPEKVYQRLTYTQATTRGATGELIAGLKLSSEYDRLYALHGIVDFLGIRFPTESDPGEIDFIEIKATKRGTSGRLSGDQNKLKTLIEKGGKILFKTVLINVETASSSLESMDANADR